MSASSRQVGFGSTRVGVSRPKSTKEEGSNQNCQPGTPADAGNGLGLTSRPMAALLSLVVRGTPSARRERGELSFAPAPVLQAQRRPFEQSLEPLLPNAVIDRTSTPGARQKRLSSPLGSNRLRENKVVPRQNKQKNFHRSSVEARAQLLYASGKAGELKEVSASSISSTLRQAPEKGWQLKRPWAFDLYNNPFRGTCFIG